MKVDPIMNNDIKPDVPITSLLNEQADASELDNKEASVNNSKPLGSVESVESVNSISPVDSIVGSTTDSVEVEIDLDSPILEPNDATTSFEQDAKSSFLSNYRYYIIFVPLVILFIVLLLFVKFPFKNKGSVNNAPVVDYSWCAVQVSQQNLPKPDVCLLPSRVVLNNEQYQDEALAFKRFLMTYQYRGEIEQYLSIRDGYSSDVVRRSHNFELQKIEQFIRSNRLITMNDAVNLVIAYNELIDADFADNQSASNPSAVEKVSDVSSTTDVKNVGGNDVNTVQPNTIRTPYDPANLLERNNTGNGVGFNQEQIPINQPMQNTSYDTVPNNPQEVVNEQDAPKMVILRTQNNRSNANEKTSEQILSDEENRKE